MTFIIADSGATKTEWLIISDGKCTDTVITIGFNPYYYSAEEVNNEIGKKLHPLIQGRFIDSLYFYGSGVSTANKKQQTKEALKPNFPDTQIIVDHDLLAAARGLFKNEAGLACILGTGSNSCVYNGHDITHNFLSLGYFFADEGSGTHLGKLFIEDYLRDKLPAELKVLTEEKFKLNPERVLEHIYTKKDPNKFLASFSPFISEQINLDYMKELVKKSFRSFFETYIIHYPGYQNLPIRFMGSVALVHQSLLQEVAGEFGLHIEQVIKSPKQGLIEYHSKLIE